MSAPKEATNQPDDRIRISGPVGDGITINRFDFAVLMDCAIRGYNAEFRYKSARVRGEHPASFAMRKANERQIIEQLRPVGAIDGLAAPQPIN